MFTVGIAATIPAFFFLAKVLDWRLSTLYSSRVRGVKKSLISDLFNQHEYLRENLNERNIEKEW